MQSQLEQYHLYSLAPPVSVRLSAASRGVVNTWSGSQYSLFIMQDLPLYCPHPLPNKQHSAGCHIPIRTGFAGFEFSFAGHAIFSLLSFPDKVSFDSDFVELLPILLSVTSCSFSFCCLVSGTTGQRGPSAWTLLLFVICSILQLLVSLSCQRHCKTEWAICMCILTHTCLCHLLLH